MPNLKVCTIYVRGKCGFVSVWDLTRKHSVPGNVLKLEYVMLTNFLFKIFNVTHYNKCHIYF